jgi:rhodanese-related sulfurtransferase
LSDIPEIDPAGAQALLDGGALLLDVREDDEWAAGHAPGATHLRLGLLGADRPANDGRTVVAVCRSGARSAKAAEALRLWGYDAVNLAGGMQAWAAAGLPVVTDDGGPGAVA